MIFKFLGRVRNRLPLQHREVLLESKEETPFTLTNNTAWSSMFTSGHGFVKLAPDPEGNSYWVVAMVEQTSSTVNKALKFPQYHQLHCVNNLRQFFIQLESRPATPREKSHIGHCLSILRQAVLCDADTSLYPTRHVALQGGGETYRIAGPVTHVCRDWTRVMQYVEANFQTWKEEASHYIADEPGTSAQHLK
jgi:hypothetical protein